MQSPLQCPEVGFPPGPALPMFTWVSAQFVIGIAAALIGLGVLATIISRRGLRRLWTILAIGLVLFVVGATLTDGVVDPWRQAIIEWTYHASLTAPSIPCAYLINARQATADHAAENLADVGVYVSLIGIAVAGFASVSHLGPFITAWRQRLFGGREANGS